MNDESILITYQNFLLLNKRLITEPDVVLNVCNSRTKKIKEKRIKLKVILSYIVNSRTSWDV